MKIQSLARFDPSQPDIWPDSSVDHSAVREDDQSSALTADPPAERFVVYSAAASPGIKDSFESNPLPLEETVQPENTDLKQNSPSPVILLRRSPTIQNRFVPLQKWEGVVLEVLADSFIARLVDLTNNGPDEEAEFPLEEVSVSDRVLVKPGAIFYWNIGYTDSVSGQRTRDSILRFRRLPVWRTEEIENAKRRAQRLRDLLDWK